MNDRAKVYICRLLTISWLCYAGLAAAGAATEEAQRAPLLQSTAQKLLVENECQESASVLVDGPHHYTANHLCEAIERAATQGLVEISPGANVTFRSGSFGFGSQFKVVAGGHFSAQLLASVNRYLSGRLFIGDQGRYLDLSSGEYASLVPYDISRIIHAFGQT